MQVIRKGIVVLLAAAVVLAWTLQANSAAADQAVRLDRLGVYMVGDALYVRGPTTQRQASQVQRFMAENEVKRVVLSGNGGDLLAGFRIGKLIRNEGAVVQVTTGTYCVSACAFAALGAKDGRIMLGGKLLFHRGYIPQVPIMVTLDDIARVNQYIAIISTHYLLELGYSTDFSLRIARDTSPCSFMLFSDTISIRKLHYGQPKVGGHTRGYIIHDLCEARR